MLKLSSREEKSQRIVGCGRNRAQVECLSCGTVHTVDRDEDGGAGIEQWPCEGSDSCTSMLCSECRHQCHECGSYSCADDLKDHVCQICRERERALRCASFFESHPAERPDEDPFGDAA